MKKSLLFLACLWAGSASAQFTPGQILTAGELNSQFALYAPLAGASFTGGISATGLTGTPVSGSTGSFTTLAASGAVTGAGFTSLLSPYALLSGAAFGGGISATSITGTPISGSTGSFTTLSASSTVTLPAGSVPLTEIATQAANTILANATASTASPTAIAAPSCSTTSSALLWTTSSGLSCNTTINASSLGGTAAASYALLASPTFTGTPAAPTASATTNTTQLATTAMVNSAITGGSLAGSFTTANASGNDALTYNNTSAQSIPSGASTVITGWTKVSDRVNANFNASTGVFTAPATGVYVISGGIQFSATTVSATFAVQVACNGAVIAQGLITAYSTNSIAASPSIGSAVCSLTSGQTATLRAFQATGSSVALTSSTASTNWVSIYRLP